MPLVLAGRWEVVRSLGAGGGGEVLLTRDLLAGGAPRAVKLLADRRLEQHLRREFVALASLSHPGVVRVRELGQDAERGPLLVTDVVDGPDLIAAGRGLLPAELVALLARLIKALAYVHARGVLHLDLKPGNVLVEGGRPRLLDFGLAGAEWTEASGATPAYAAPEQLRGLAVDRRADLFAVGALAFELVEGTAPFGRSLREVRAAHEQPAPLARGPLAPVIAALLARDPAARPGSAAEALLLLAGVARAESGAGVAPAAAGRKGARGSGPAAETPASPVGNAGAPGAPGATGQRSSPADETLRAAGPRSSPTEEDDQERAAFVPVPAGTVRQQPLAAIAAALAAGGPVVVAGPAGSGKRALLSEALLGGAGAGRVVLRAAEVGPGLPLQALVPVLRAADALLPARAEAQARALLAPWLGETEQAGRPAAANSAFAVASGQPLPDSSRSRSAEQDAGPDAASGPASSETSRAPSSATRFVASLPALSDAALGVAAAQLIRAAGSVAPLLVVVDAADRLDGGSRAALDALAAPVQLLVSAENPAGLPGTVIALAPLDAPEVQRYLAGVYPGRAVPESLAAELLAWSGGLPALLEEAVFALAAAGAAVPGASTSTPLPARLPAGALPPAGGAAALAAARALREEPLFAALLALAGRALSLSCLAEAAGTDPATARASTSRLAAVGAAAFVDGPAPGARISGAALAGAIAARLAPDELRRHHLGLAAAATRERAGASGAGAALLAADAARHLLAAGAPGAAAAAAEAGLLCAGASAPREAAALLGAALEAGAGDCALRCAQAAALAASGEPDLALAAYARAGAEGAAGEAAVGAGEVLVRRGAFRDAGELLERALPQASRLLLPRLLATLARTLALAGRPDDALLRAGEATAALAAIPGAPDPRIASELAAARGFALYLAGRSDEATAAYRGAEEAAAQGGDLSRQAAAVNGRAMVAHRRGEAVQARALYEEALALAQAGFDLSRAGACHLNLGALGQDRGDTADAATHYRQAAAVARALGDPAAVARAELNLAVLHRFVGRLEEARRAAAAGKAAAARAGAAPVLALCRAVEGEVLLLAGEAGEARSVLAEALGQLTGAAERLDVEVTLGEAELAAGEPRAARERAERLAEAARGQPSVRIRALLLLAEAELSRHGVAALARGALHEALALSEARPRPDLRWRLHRALSAAHRAAGEGELAGFEAAIARRLLADAARVLPPSDRATFTARPDRRRAEAELVLQAPGAGPGAGSPGAARILAINRRIGAERDLDRLLEAIVDAAIELTGAERGFVLLPAREGGFDIRVGRGFEQRAVTEGDVPVSRSIAERVMRTGEPELAPDALEDDRYREQLSIHLMRLRSVLCVPLSFRGERLGALYLDNRLRAEAFGAEAVELLEAFADQAAISLGNARAIAEVEEARAASASAAEEVQRLAARLSDRVEVQAAELAAAREVLGETRPVGGILGQSQPMRRLFRALEKVAAVQVPVLIQGESGTGKELVARAVHTLGPRRERPFVSVNCSALVETLLESELFGHVRGAFTGADRERRGLFELADGGTLFLDEVGDMGLAMQAKLLRALQSGEVWKVGGPAALKVDVRVVAATNRPVPRLVAEGRFREDLYYRLNVVTLEVPPLRDRKDDLPVLVDHFLRAVAGPDGKGPRLRIEAAALQALAAHDWPGNVRELESTIKNAAIFAEGGVIRVADLPLKGTASLHPGQAEGAGAAGTLALADAELVFIEQALAKANGNKALAARMLGIDRKTLYNKLRRTEKA